jgi:hypothetical protein
LHFYGYRALFPRATRGDCPYGHEPDFPVRQGGALQSVDMLSETSDEVFDLFWTVGHGLFFFFLLFFIKANGFFSSSLTSKLYFMLQGLLHGNLFYTSSNFRQNARGFEPRLSIDMG